MNFKWIIRMRHWRQDLFIHTQNRLTLQYSVLIMFFLIIFVTVVYFFVDAFITFDQERQLRMVTDQKAKAIKEALQDRILTQDEFDNLNSIRESGNQFFYYVVDANGRLLFGDEVIPRMREELLHRLGGWIPYPQEIRYETMKMPPPRRVSQRFPKARSIDMMIAGRGIYQGDQLLMSFYTGKDISFINVLMKQLLIILMVLGALFLVVAFFLSYFMSKRAMRPIRTSFDRQREFVADASHELRTPLSILHSSLDVLEMEEETRFSDYSRKVFFNMRDEVRRMGNLVSDLLTLARSDSGVPDLKKEPFDIIPAIVQLVETTDTLAQSKQIRLHLDAPPTLTAYGDQEKLKQLLYILIDNAIKYTPNDGEVNLTISVEREGKISFLRIVVQDTGIGIPLEEQERIYDRLYRVDKNRSRQMGGTGIGLAIAKWIVEAHYGSIKVYSEVGKGSRFIVRLPIMAPQG